MGVETEGSFDGIEGRICGVYEAHERVIELLEAGAPLSLESRRLLDSMAASLEDCEEQGLSVGAKDEVDAVLARAAAHPEARRLFDLAASRGNAKASHMRC